MDPVVVEAAVEYLDRSRLCYVERPAGTQLAWGLKLDRQFRCRLGRRQEVD